MANEKEPLRRLFYSDSGVSRAFVQSGKAKYTLQSIVVK